MENNLKSKRHLAMEVPLAAAWVLAIACVIFPFLIIFNPGEKFAIDSFWGGFGLAVMVMTLIYFLVDAIVAGIRCKPAWIIFLLIFPSITQVAYLLLKGKYLKE